MNTKITVALTTPQADWLRSTASTEGISIASVVRGMIDAERVEDDVEARSTHLPMVRIATEPDVGFFDSMPTMSEPGGGPYETCKGRCAILCTGWWLYDGEGLLLLGATETQAIDWCLNGVLP